MTLDRNNSNFLFINNIKNIPFVKGTISHKIIYVYTTDSPSHKNCVKIGDTTIDISIGRNLNQILDDSKELKDVAERRIRTYDRTTDEINILYVTLAIDNNEKPFRDYDVHRILKRSGYGKIKKGKSTEWFEISKEIAIQAIQDCKAGKNYSNLPNDSNSEITFRPEQEEAINKTFEVFKTKNEMLWNAKMRFGKTLCALQVVKKCEFKKTLIITHRPNVRREWSREFKKIFNDDSYVFGSKQEYEKIECLVSETKKFVYFVSMQDLRGSKAVNDKTGIDKNNEIFDIEWDLIIIDEAHEGTNTELAKKTLQLIKNKNKNIKLLELSGTPFNIIWKYEPSEIFSWDYVLEQEAKAKWDYQHDGDSNPYADLPSIWMFIYSLSERIKDSALFQNQDHQFNFTEFFKTNKNDEFEYKEHVNNFLDILSGRLNDSSSEDNMPFANESFRKELKHTLWTLPNISSTRALEKLLQEHEIFKCFKIINLSNSHNASGSYIEGEIKKDIKNRGIDSRTITLTVRKATVGTTVREWTGILVLNNTESASQYFQQIFRVQSPYSSEEGHKEKAYVFDFAPDRFLKMMNNTYRIEDNEFKANPLDNDEYVKRILNFLPIISINGNKLIKSNFDQMISSLNKQRVYRTVYNGFDCDDLYSSKFNDLTDEDIEKFQKLNSKIESVKKSAFDRIKINNQGLDNQTSGLTKSNNEKERNLDNNLEENNLNKNKEKLISILRGITIRIPWLAYISSFDDECDESIYLDKFIESVDQNIWNEFMHEIDKNEFLSFKKFFDTRLLCQSIKKIISDIKEAQSSELSIKDRINKISTLVSSFKCVDRNSIFAPWKVINNHITSSFGGFDFDKNEWINSEYESIFENDKKILEIDSKTGLYPLHLAYDIYLKNKKDNLVDDKELFSRILENNIYCLTKSLMNKQVINKTLFGFANHKFEINNIWLANGLFEIIKNKNDLQRSKIIETLNLKDINFDLVIGNPSYGLTKTENIFYKPDQKQDQMLYPSFFYMSKELSSNWISLVLPSNWLFASGRTDKEFDKDLIQDKHVRKVLIKYDNSIFPELKGNDFLYLDYTKNREQKCLISSDGTKFHDRLDYLDFFDLGLFIPYIEMKNIIMKINNKVADLDNNNFSKIASIRNPYGLHSDAFTNYEKYKLSYEDNINSSDTDLKVTGLLNGKRIEKYITQETYQKYLKENFNKTNLNINNLNKWKVFISKAPSSREFGSKLSELIVARPNHICTETFISFGCFDTEQEAKFLTKYCHSKFFRSLLSVLKTSQNASRKVYQLIPLQDFTPNSDIDWTKSVSEIDKQLYAKYELNEEEIKFIESKVKSM